jgi:hypothetical protein
MGAPLKAGIPPDALLTNGCTVTFAALNPSNGAVVSGVVLTSSSLLIEGTGSAHGDTSGPFMLVPGPGA